MTEKEFIKKLLDRATVHCQIPIKFNEDSVKSFISESAEVFYKRYHDASSEEYIIMELDMFQTPLFRAKRQVILPSCVRAITMLRETNTSGFGRFYEIAPDYKKLSYPLEGYGKSYAGRSDLLYAVTEHAYEDFIMTNFRLSTVRFSYNDINRRLTVLGRDPTNALVADAVVNIPLEDLYNSVYFFKKVLSEIYYHADMVISLIEFNAVGGYRIDGSKLERFKEIKRVCRGAGPTKNSWARPPTIALKYEYQIFSRQFRFMATIKRL